MTTGFVGGSGNMNKGFSDVGLRLGTTLLIKPASVAEGESTFYGVKAVDTALVVSAPVTADDGKSFILDTQATKYVFYADLGGLGTETQNVKDVYALEDGVKFVSVPFVDGGTLETFGINMKNAANQHFYCKQEVLATFDTATTTFTALEGNASGGIVDVDFGAILTLTKATPGVGDFIRIAQTAEGQNIGSEEGTSVQSGQGKKITLSDIVTSGVNALNYSPENHKFLYDTFNRQSCQLVMYQKDSKLKVFETLTAIMNVRKVAVDGSRYETEITSSTDTSDPSTVNAAWSLNVDG